MMDGCIFTYTAIIKLGRARTLFNITDCICMKEVWVVSRMFQVKCLVVLCVCY